MDIIITWAYKQRDIDIKEFSFGVWLETRFRDYMLQQEQTVDFKHFGAGEWERIWRDKVPVDGDPVKDRQLVWGEFC